MSCWACMYGARISVWRRRSEEGVARPAAFHFDDLERDSPQEVFEGGSDADTVPLEYWETCCPGCSLDTPNKDFVGERAPMWLSKEAWGSVGPSCRRACALLKRLPRLSSVGSVSGLATWGWRAGSRSVSR